MKKKWMKSLAILLTAALLLPSGPVMETAADGTPVEITIDDSEDKTETRNEEISDAAKPAISVTVENGGTGKAEAEAVDVSQSGDDIPAIEVTAKEGGSGEVSVKAEKVDAGGPGVSVKTEENSASKVDVEVKGISSTNAEGIKAESGGSGDVAVKSEDIFVRNENAGGIDVVSSGSGNTNVNTGAIYGENPPAYGVSVENKGSGEVAVTAGNTNGKTGIEVQQSGSGSVNVTAQNVNSENSAIHVNTAPASSGDVSVTAGSVSYPEDKTPDVNKVFIEQAGSGKVDVKAESIASDFSNPLVIRQSGDVKGDTKVDVSGNVGTVYGENGITVESKGYGGDVTVDVEGNVTVGAAKEKDSAGVSVSRTGAGTTTVSADVISAGQNNAGTEEASVAGVDIKLKNGYTESANVVLNAGSVKATADVSAHTGNQSVTGIAVDADNIASAKITVKNGVTAGTNGSGSSSGSNVVDMRGIQANADKENASVKVDVQKGGVKAGSTDPAVGGGSIGCGIDAGAGKGTIDISVTGGVDAEGKQYGYGLNLTNEEGNVDVKVKDGDVLALTNKVDSVEAAGISIRNDDGTTSVVLENGSVRASGRSANGVNLRGLFGENNGDTDITLTDGDIIAKGSSGSSAGARLTVNDGKNSLTLENGSVTASGESYADGIVVSGGSKDNMSDTTITLKQGDVSASLENGQEANALTLNVDEGGKINVSLEDGNIEASGGLLDTGILTSTGGKTKIDLNGDITVDAEGRAMGAQLVTYEKGETSLRIHDGNITASASKETGGSGAYGIYISNHGTTDVTLDNGDIQAKDAAVSNGIDVNNQSGTTRLTMENGSVTATGENVGNAVTINNEKGKVYLEFVGDLTGSSTGVEVTNADNDADTEIRVDGTISGTNGVGIATKDSTIKVTAWEVKPDKAGAHVSDNAVVEKNIRYIIKVEQPSVGTLKYNVKDGKGETGVKIGNNTYDTALENETILIHVAEIPAGYELKGAYNGKDSRVLLSKNEDGVYFLIVPRGGAIWLSAVLEKIREEKEEEPEEQTQEEVKEEPQKDPADGRKEEEKEDPQNAPGDNRKEDENEETGEKDDAEEREEKTEEKDLPFGPGPVNPAVWEKPEAKRDSADIREAVVNTVKTDAAGTGAALGFAFAPAGEEPALNVIVLLMDGSRIRNAAMDQIMFVEDAEDRIPLTAEESRLAEGFAEGRVLMSLRQNAASEDEEIRETLEMLDAAQDFAAGKTIAELKEAAQNDELPENVTKEIVDAIFTASEKTKEVTLVKTSENMKACIAMAETGEEGALTVASIITDGEIVLGGSFDEFRIGSDSEMTPAAGTDGAFADGLKEGSVLADARENAKDAAERLEQAMRELEGKTKAELRKMDGAYAELALQAF